jgi:hypothetical protein
MRAAIVFDAYVREVQPRFLVRRTFQRTIYRPAELIQCDLWEPSEHVPVGYGQTHRGWVMTCQSCWSRAFAGTLIFSKEAPDIPAGLARNLKRLSVRAEKPDLGPRVSNRRASRANASPERTNKCVVLRGPGLGYLRFLCALALRFLCPLALALAFLALQPVMKMLVVWWISRPFWAPKKVGICSLCPQKL